MYVCITPFVLFFVLFSGFFPPVFRRLRIVTWLVVIDASNGQPSHLPTYLPILTKLWTESVWGVWILLQVFEQGGDETC